MSKQAISSQWKQLEKSFDKILSTFKKSNDKGGWEQGPRGGTRRRTPGGGWEYKTDGAVAQTRSGLDIHHDKTPGHDMYYRTMDHLDAAHHHMHEAESHKRAAAHHRSIGNDDKSAHHSARAKDSSKKMNYHAGRLGLGENPTSHPAWRKQLSKRDPKSVPYSKKLARKVRSQKKGLDKIAAKRVEHWAENFGPGGSAIADPHDIGKFRYILSGDSEWREGRVDSDTPFMRQYNNELKKIHDSVQSEHAKEVGNSGKSALKRMFGKSMSNDIQLYKAMEEMSSIIEMSSFAVSKFTQ